MTNQNPAEFPVFSVIVPVHNDREALLGCLCALSGLPGVPNFEVIVVDDGSEVPVGNIASQVDHEFPLTVIRQNHTGVSSARNRGIQASNGSVLVFIDADCRIQPNCLVGLGSKLANEPLQDCFQLRLVGDCTNRVGRAEHLRLITLQDYLLQTDGRIRYLNTAGFAVRRGKVPTDGNLFDPAAARAEDTLLLASLIQKRDLPAFAPEAVVQHDTSFSLKEYFCREIRSVYLELNTYDTIAATGIHLRVTNRERLVMAARMWKTSCEGSIGRLAWFIVTARQVLRFIMHLGHRVSRLGARSTHVQLL